MTEAPQYPPPPAADEDTGQDSAAQPTSWPRGGPYARARVARARGSVGTALSTVAARVDATVSRERSPGEVSRLWIDGAPSPADVVDRCKAGPPAPHPWPAWQVTLWRAWHVVVLLPGALAGQTFAFAFSGVLRSVAALVLLGLLWLTTGVAP